MAIKVLKTNSTSSETSTELDIFSDVSLPRKEKVRIAREAKDIIKDEILKSVGNAKSPLAGGSWPALSPGYKAYKRSKNLPGKANMEFSGDMLDSFDGEVSKSGKITMGFFGDQAEKAEGHNNFTGESTLPTRRSIPGEGDKFKRGIEKKIEQLVAEAVAKNTKLPVRKLSQVSSKSQLFSVLGEIFVGMSRAQITDALVSNEDLVQLLTELDLIRFLDL